MRLTLKIEYLARSFTHWAMGGLASRGIGLAGSYPIFTRWNVARMLVMAALLSGVAVVYFNLAPEGAGKTEALPQVADSRSVRGDPSWMRRLNNDDEWRYSSPYVQVFSAAANSAPPAVPPITDDELWVAPHYEHFSAHGELGPAAGPYGESTNEDTGSSTPTRRR
jgi:hypothetical protein